MWRRSKFIDKAFDITGSLKDYVKQTEALVTTGSKQIDKKKDNIADKM